MKTSELIAALQTVLERHGDIEVVSVDDDSTDCHDLLCLSLGRSRLDSKTNVMAVVVDWRSHDRVIPAAGSYWEPEDTDAPAAKPQQDDRHMGLHRKFDVRRTDGSSDPGGKHEHCFYFVLDLNHDRYAVPALEAYGNACYPEHRQLSEGIRHIVASAKAGFGGTPKTTGESGLATPASQTSRVQLGPEAKPAQDASRTPPRAPGW